MEAIFGLSTTAQLIVAPIVAFGMLWICFGLIPSLMDRLHGKGKSATNQAVSVS